MSDADERLKADDRLKEGVEHLQAAALELIAAARAVLDVAEDLVKDPADLVARVNGFAERARDATAHVRATPGRGDDDDGVQRIHIA